MIGCNSPLNLHLSHTAAMFFCKTDNVMAYKSFFTHVRNLFNNHYIKRILEKSLRILIYLARERFWLLMPFGFDDFASQFRHFASQSAAQWPSLKEGEIKPGLGNMAPQSNIEDEKENIHSSEMMFSGGLGTPQVFFYSLHLER